MGGINNKLNRTIVSQFPFYKRCERCDVILSASLWDTKPVAIRLKRVNQTDHQYECVQCATKKYFSFELGKKIVKPSLKEIDRFLIWMNFKMDKDKHEKKLISQKNYRYNKKQREKNRGSSRLREKIRKIIEEIKDEERLERIFKRLQNEDF